MSEDSQAELIAAQLRHTIDLLRADVRELTQQVEHNNQFQLHRITQLEEAQKDHETRIRGLTDGVIQFKVWAGLTSGGSGLVSLAALLRAWLGG